MFRGKRPQIGGKSFVRVCLLCTIFTFAMFVSLKLFKKRKMEYFLEGFL